MNLKHYSSSIKTWELMKVFNIHHFFKAFHEQFHGTYYTWCGTPFLMAASRMSHNTKVSQRFRSWTGIENSHKIWVQFLTGKLRQTECPVLGCLDWYIWKHMVPFAPLKNELMINGTRCPYLSEVHVPIWGFAPRATYLRKPWRKIPHHHSTMSLAGSLGKDTFYFTAILSSFTITWLASLTPPSVQHG